MLAMGEHDDEELKLAFRMSLQPAPDAKRSKPRDITESPEAMDRRLQRELRAAAAEQRRVSALGALDPSSSVQVDVPLTKLRTPTKLTDRSEGLAPLRDATAEKTNRGKRRVEDERQQLPLRLAEQLYLLVFGTKVSKDVLCQWCHQGFRFDISLFPLFKPHFLNSRAWTYIRKRCHMSFLRVWKWTEVFVR